MLSVAKNSLRPNSASIYPFLLYCICPRFRKNWCTSLLFVLSSQTNSNEIIFLLLQLTSQHSWNTSYKRESNLFFWRHKTRVRYHLLTKNSQHNRWKVTQSRFHPSCLIWTAEKKYSAKDCVYNLNAKKERPYNHLEDLLCLEKKNRMKKINATVPVEVLPNSSTLSGKW